METEELVKLIRRNCAFLDPTLNGRHATATTTMWLNEIAALAAELGRRVEKVTLF
jgi:hypothetical protein